MYTLDTNAIIYYLKDDPKAVPALRKIFIYRDPIYISAVTEAELFGFPGLTSQEERVIEDLVRTVVVIPLDSQIARIAGFLRRQYKTKIADSAIAATALLTDTTLATRNVRDFQKVPDLSLMKI